MDRKIMRDSTRECTTIENGDCLSKMPTATAEQLNIVRILSKPGDDVDLRRLVSQLKELTACNEDQAVTALYDCENDLERAVELLLDRLRGGTDEEWHTTGRKLRAKHATEDRDTSPHGRSVDGETDNERLGRLKVCSESSGKSDSSPGHQAHCSQHDVAEVQPRKRDGRGKSVLPASQTSRTPTEFVKGSADVRPKVDNPRGLSLKRNLAQTSITDGWDPYTEYGEWGGEAIEVVNSKASIAHDFHEDPTLPDGLFVDTDNHSVKAADSPNSGESMAHSPDSDLSSKLSSITDKESIFVSRASSKAPPAAFSSLPDAPVFIAPDLLVHSSSQWKYKFGDNVWSSIIPSVPCASVAPRTLKTSLSQTPKSNLMGTASGLSDTDPQVFSPFVSSQPSSKISNTSYRLENTARSLLDNPSTENDTTMSSSQYPEHFSNATLTPKVSATFSSTQKSQSSSAANFEADVGAGQSSFLESSLKNYMLDNLPEAMNKLSTGDSSQASKQPQFNLQQSTAQAQAVGPPFTHNQVHASLQHHIQKAPLPHISLHTSQQPLVSNPSQAHQQAAAIPPGMPHFISQFAPPAYHMFNLPSGSGNAPIFDLDQLQLLQQQQRLFYDMHLQHQSATTAQSLISSSDASSTSKSNHIAGPLGHVSASNPAIRSDMLAPAIGHAPQMMPPGHSYFSYPGFVVMNGYANAFLNQQQSNQDGQAQSTGHGISPLGQQQSQPTNTTQSYGGLKPVNANVVGYDDIFELKYNDPSKQVGYKTNTHPPSSYGSYQAHVSSTDGVGSKMSAGGHPVGGILTQGFNPNTSGIGNGVPQPFSPSFYPPAAAPYLSAAVAVAAAAAASAQQQQQQQQHQQQPLSGNTNVNSAGQTNTGGGGGSQSGPGVAGPSQMHLPNNPGQALVLGNSSPGLHAHHTHHPHQRSVLPH